MSKEAQTKYTRDHMMIPQTTKVAIKLWFVSLGDIAIVGGCMYLGSQIGNLYANSPVFQITTAIVSFLIGLFIIIRPSVAPGMRNWRAIIFVWLQDKKRYLPIEVTNYTEKQLEKLTKKEAIAPVFKAKQKDYEELCNTMALGGPISCTDDGILKSNDKSVTRYLKLKSAPLFQMSDNELEEWQDALTDLSRQYTEDCSYLSLPSKIDTTENQRYWRYMRQKCGPGVKERQRARDIGDQIARAEVVELRPEQYRSINYYAQLYADSATELRRRTDMFIMAAGKLSPTALNKKETEELLKEINNPANN
ncbi:MAG: hypothetical protein M3Z87_01570 [Lactobacillus sp.]|nr:hypothetical protein [Lactobacillus sp.]